MTILREYRSWWKLQGRSPAVADDYCRYLAGLAKQVPLESATLADVLDYVAAAETAPTRRQRARAAKSFYRWGFEQDALPDASWWRRIPSLNEKASPQPTTEPEQVDDLLRSIKGNTFAAARDRAIVGVLWCSGVRRSELVRLRVVDVGEGFLSVISSKGARPRLVPLSPQASGLLLRYMRVRDKHPFRDSPSLWLGERGPISACGVREMLERRGAPSSHSFRRGWCCDNLRAGISQASIQVAAGWSGPQMVSRYSAMLSNEVSLSEFSRRYA